MREGLTQKQETFTLNLFKGMYQRDAYIDAYKPTYALSTIDEAASRLASNVKVKARLQELREATEDSAIATVGERKKVLSEIVRGRFVDFMTNLTAEKLKSAALQEIRIVEFTGLEEGAVKKKSTTIKLHSPIQAIAELNKMERIYEGEASVVIDNRTLVINVISGEAKDLTQRIIEGERTDDKIPAMGGHKVDNGANP